MTTSLAGYARHGGFEALGCATYGQEFGTVTPLYQPGRAVLISASAKF